MIDRTKPLTFLELRERIADLIEDLIDLLDAIDGDADLEPSISGDDRELDMN
nr:hypothetical protein [uncultured Cohaesibacter sp.]